MHKFTTRIQQLIAGTLAAFLVVAFPLPYSASIASAESADPTAESTPAAADPSSQTTATSTDGSLEAAAPTDSGSSESTDTVQQPTSDPNNSAAEPAVTPSSDTPDLTSAPSQDPAAATVQSAPSPQENTTTADQSLKNVRKPRGADAQTYHYNTTTGLWENDYYTWNPATGQTAPRTPQTYSYNPSTGMWDTTTWRYDAPTGKYVANTTSVVAEPMLQVAKSATTGNGQTSLTVSENNNTFDLFYNASISNTLSSGATSGNALLIGNTSAGNATTGDASVIANIINLLQSSANLSGANTTVFTSNIVGNVQGDILIDPSILAQLQPSSDTTSGDIALNTANNGSITNDIQLAAKSGDATISDNTSAGNASSGDATAIANVVNLINSVIASGQSFIGVVNIYGNLEGNILVPQDFINSLIASNTPGYGTTSVNATDNQTITNDVIAAAKSGNATVSGNTSAGNATSGNAATNITVLNLTGKQVIADNSLLVFVNVLGTWVGLIMDAPQGSTAAAFGGDVAETSNTGAINGNTTTNQLIANNILASAATGDATVNHNTKAGTATSGNASTAVNLANITNSQFSLNGWFGILFINVLGSWLGNFGVKLPPTTPANSDAGTTANGINEIKVFRFIPSTGAQKTSQMATYAAPSTGNGTTTNATVPVTAVLAAAHIASDGMGSKALNISSSQSADTSHNFAIAAAIVALGLSLYAIDLYSTIRKRHGMNV